MIGVEWQPRKPDEKRALRAMVNPFLAIDRFRLGKKQKFCAKNHCGSCSVERQYKGGGGAPALLVSLGMSSPRVHHC